MTPSSPSPLGQSTDIFGLPRGGAVRGRAACRRGHTWKTIEMTSWRWSTKGRGSRVAHRAGDHVRRPLSETTYSSPTCPFCGSGVRGFRVVHLVVVRAGSVDDIVSEALRRKKDLI